MTDPRNIDDVQYVTSSELESKPMREVLRDRAARHARQPKALREEAFRVRAGMQALMLSCLCCWPLEKAATESEHPEWCPAHRIPLELARSEEASRRWLTHYCTTAMGRSLIEILGVTPRFIADAIGEVDLDPCSNDRSHIHAKKTFSLDAGQNGLALARFVGRDMKVWCNPPYSRGNVIRWVRAYGHTRFMFLVRMDTSTIWFSELERRTDAICVLREMRTNFEPPPGVDGDDSNTFPHGIFYANADDITDAVKRLCYHWTPRRKI